MASEAGAGGTGLPGRPANDVGLSHGRTEGRGLPGTEAGGGRASSAAASVNSHAHALVSGPFDLGPALSNGLGGLGGRSKDLPVEEHHDQHRGVEGAHGRVDDVARLLDQLALGKAPVQGLLDHELIALTNTNHKVGQRLVGVVVGIMLLPSNQGWEADDEGQDPGGGNEQLGASGGHDVGIGDGVGHSDVAVQGDHHQMQDGGRACPDVYSQPN